LALDEEKVEKVVTTALKPIIIEFGHFNNSLNNINKKLEGLPCDNLTGDLKQLRTEFDMRVAEFEKEASKREKSLATAWAHIREIETDPPLKEEVEKLQDKKEIKMWGTIILLFSFVLNAVGYLIRE